MSILLQLMIVGAWGAALAIQTRRLLRLASVTVTSGDSQLLRQKARRVWWWLGRDEFWRDACSDIARCLELTLMIVVMAWMF